MPFDTLLIANRGEIACRVIRSASAMGLRTVAVYSDADAGAPHTLLADEAVRIGAGPVGESYLKVEAVLEAAKSSGAGAIHPGYGFLSENADFARAVAKAGVVFVGPPPNAIDVMGDKAGSKRAMIAAGVPCVPGYQGADQSDATLIAEATKIGMPVMIKASAGGGGRGMRLVHDAKDLGEAIARARSEALGAFGSDILIVEKAVMRPRHVEVQVFADSHGTCVHLGERDCSVQRRHQKVVEEAPCPVMTPALRAQMGAAAVAAAQAVDYVGAGTVEFLLDASGDFYFLEMNTRLQVEHPVTEMITGLDLVTMQLRVAQGAPLGLTQDDVRLSGHAMEVRLYAEDPANDFLPVTGDIALWDPASGEGIRVDAGIATGQQIPPFYDPMLAKIIAHGPDRQTARQRLIAALDQTAILGVTTNRQFLRDILQEQVFAEGEATTAFIAETWPQGISTAPARSADVALAAVLLLDHRASLLRAGMSDDILALAGFASDATLSSILDLAVEDEAVTIVARPVAGVWHVSTPEWTHQVALLPATNARRRATIDGKRADVAVQITSDETVYLSHSAGSLTARPHAPWDNTDQGADSSRIIAPMPGLVVSLSVAPGDTVQKGQTVAVLEAMKMQHQLIALADGTVSEVGVQQGDQVASGAVIALLEVSE